MRQQSLMFGMIFAILLTAGTAIIVVSFQLKNDNLAREVIASPVRNSIERPIENIISQRPIDVEVTEPRTPRLPLPVIDAVLNNSEYEHSYIDSEIDIQLYWTVRTETAQEPGALYAALLSPLGGCVGISLGPSGPRIKGGDILSGFIDEAGETQFRDSYANEATSHSSDEELALDSEVATEEETTTEGEEPAPSHYGTNDITDAKGRILSNNTTFIEFIRPLDTGDNAYDKPIIEGMMRVQLGFSDSADFNCFQTETQVTKLINFFTGETEEELQS